MLMGGLVRVGTVKPKFEVADVFRRYGRAYRRQHHISWEQHKAIRDITNCRTATLERMATSIWGARLASRQCCTRGARR